MVRKTSTHSYWVFVGFCKRMKHIACLYNHNLIHTATAVQATRALMSLYWTRRVTCNMIQGLIYHGLRPLSHLHPCPSWQWHRTGSSWFEVRTLRWRPCGVTWESSLTVVVIKLRRTSALAASGRYQANEAISHWLPNKS